MILHQLVEERNDELTNDGQLCRVGCHFVAYTFRQGRSLNIVYAQPSLAVASPITYLTPANAAATQARYAGWDPRLTHILSRIADNNALEWNSATCRPSRAVRWY
jgi:hypothetical protein